MGITGVEGVFRRYVLLGCTGERRQQSAFSIMLIV